MNILLIYDKLPNGKCWEDLLIDCEKKNHKEIKKNYDFSKFKIIVFSFNECSLNNTGVNFNKLISLRNEIKKLKKIKIINDPKYYKIHRSKLEIHNVIKKNNIDINICNTKEIKSEVELDIINYPCIIANPVSAGGKKRKLYREKKETNKIIGRLNKEKLICIEYVESKLFGKYFCGRICAFNKRIIYYFPRFGNKWNVGIFSQIFESNLLEKGFKFMKENLNELEKIVNEITKLFINTFYAMDVIFNNHNKKWYLCEVGYKFKPISFLGNLKKMNNISNEFKITDKEYNNMVKEIIENDTCYL